MALVEQSGAEESFVGIGLAFVAVTFQPLIIIWKLRIAQRANLRSLAIEAKESVACSFLSLALLIGLVANALLGWWWLDSATALLLVPWLVREGLDGIRGKQSLNEVPLCSCITCLFGIRTCKAVCCTL